MHELGSRHVDPARDAHLAVLGKGPAVEDDQLAARGPEPPQLLGRNVRGAVGRFHELAKALARHVDALEQHEPRVTPRLNAAFEHGDIRVTVASKDRGGPPGEAFATIGQDHGCGAPRHQPGHVDLQAAQRRVAGEQDMGARERPLLAHVEQRDLAPVLLEPRPQRGRRDPRAHLWILGLAG